MTSSRANVPAAIDRWLAIAVEREASDVHLEYRFPRVSSSIVTQREVGMDVGTFLDGLKYGVRQDPDVILVGEIRDRDTARIALSAAETGHLVLSTLYTRDAKGAISRFVDLFPQAVQYEVRAQLALALRAVVAGLFRVLANVPRQSWLDPR